MFEVLVDARFTDFNICMKWPKFFMKESDFLATKCNESVILTVGSSGLLDKLYCHVLLPTVHGVLIGNLI